VTLRIEKRLEGKTASFKLIGRIQGDRVATLQKELEGVSEQVVLDLQYLTLVDLEAVRFLRDSEARGVKLLHCSPYVREWINREKS